MPQPDNRREQGAVTRGSQQEIAPRGQAPANISPIIGGAVSPGPQVQIGVQAQIQDSGTALYDAISGATKGIQRGIENYEKLYKLQSEKDYAEFETQYLQESERVKNDPAKLKAWIDTQSYKPNRITSRRYNGLKAEINGKAYDDEQRDQWIDHLRRTTTMTPQQALEYYNDNIDQYDNNDFVYKAMEEQIIKLDGQVAASARNTNIALQKKTFIEDNYRVIQDLHNIGFSDLSGPAMEKVFAAASLGLVYIDPQTGTIVHNNERYTPNNLLQQEGFLTELTAKLGEQAAIKGADYVGAAMEAARLPITVTRSSGSSNKPADLSPVFADARSAVKSNDPTALRQALGSLPASENEEPTKGLPSLVSYILRQNSADPDIYRPEDQLRQITLLLDTLTDEDSLTDANGNRPLIDRLGYSQDFDTYLKQIEPIRLQLEANREELIFKMVDGSMARFAQGSSSALSESQLRFFSRQTAIELASSFSQTGREARFHVVDVDMTTGETTPRTLNLEEIIDLPTTSVLSAVEIVDPTLSSDVPFLTISRDAKSGFVFTGSGSDRMSIQLAEQTAKIQKNIEEVRYAQALIEEKDLGILTEDQQRIGFNRIVRVSPISAIRVLATTKSPHTLIDPSNDEISEVLRQAVTPESIAQMSPQERQLLNTVAAHNTEFVTVMGNNTPEVEALYRYSGLAPTDTSDWSSWALETARAMSDPRITEYTGAAETLTADLILEDGQDSSGILTLQAIAISEDPLSADQNKQRNLLRGLDRNYTEHYKDEESIFDALVSENDTVRFSAQEFVREYFRKAPSLSNLLRQGSLDETVDIGSLIATGNIPVAHTPRNANDLYGPETNSTVESQGGLVFLDWITRNRDTKTVRGLFQAIGVDPGFSSLDQLKENPEALAKIAPLFQSIKYVPIPRTSVVTGRDEFGVYEEYEYRLDMSNIVLEDERFQEAIRNINEQRLTVTRRFYRTRSSNFEGRLSGTQLEGSQQENRVLTEGPGSTFFNPITTPVELVESLFTWISGEEEEK